MMQKLVAIWHFAVAVLLYPLAFGALIWIAWTGRSIVWGLTIVGLVLIVDRTWLMLVRKLLARRK